MLIPCLINLIIVVIVAVFILWGLEVALQPLLTLPPQLYVLIRLLVGLLVLLYFLDCVGLFVYPGLWPTVRTR